MSVSSGYCIGSKYHTVHLGFSKLMEIEKTCSKTQKKLLDSQKLFSKNRCVWVAFYFYFYFPVGYILEHLGLFGKTNWW